MLCTRDENMRDPVNHTRSTRVANKGGRHSTDMGNYRAVRRTFTSRLSDISVSFHFTVVKREAQGIIEAGNIHQLN